MLKCRKREKACQGQKKQACENAKNAKKHARAEETGMLKCKKQEKACQGQKKQAC